MSKRFVIPCDGCTIKPLRSAIEPACPTAVRRGIVARQLELENLEAISRELLMRGCPANQLQDEVKKKIEQHVARRMGEK